MVATRVTRTERALIDAAADAKGVSVTVLVRDILLPAVGREVATYAATLGGADGPNAWTPDADRRAA